LLKIKINPYKTYKQEGAWDKLSYRVLIYGLNNWNGLKKLDLKVGWTGSE